MLINVKQQFADKLLPLARGVEAKTGIKAFIALSQAALESGWGRSQLASEYNNLFGMTGLSWEALGRPVIYLPTHEWDRHAPDQIHYWNRPGDILSKTPNPNGGTDVVVNVPFRRYASWQDSIEDWALMISTAPKYAAALAEAKAGDMLKWAAAIADAKYATDRDYRDEMAALLLDPIIKGAMA